MYFNTTSSTTRIYNGSGWQDSAALATTINLASQVTGTLPVANGGTGQTSYTNGQILIGNTTGNTLSKATLTAGSGVSITNGSGSITIAAQVDNAANSGSRIYLSNSFGGF
jgi:hypothetical protein